MNEGHVRQVCYSIVDSFWNRYLQNYADYGEVSQMTQTAFSDYQTADYIVQKILSALKIDEPNEKNGEEE